MAKIKLKPPKVGDRKPSKELVAEAPQAESQAATPKDAEDIGTMRRVMGKWPTNNL